MVHAQRIRLCPMSGSVSTFQMAFSDALSAAEDPKEVTKNAQGDPEAIKLFDAARAARAHWSNFPGFSADIDVQLDEKSASGKLIVDADYVVTISGLPKDLEEGARRELNSVVGHRKDTSKEPTPAVVFDDKAGVSPLGRCDSRRGRPVRFGLSDP